MEQFCHTLFTMTATAAVAALGVMLLRLPLKKAPRWITCALWLVVFLRMVCPVSFSLPVSLMPQTVSNGAVAERVLPVSPVEVPPQITAAETPTAPAAQATTETTPAPVVQQETPTKSTGPQWPGIVFSVWAVGTAATVLWAAVSYGNLRRRISDAVLIEDNIYETDQIDTPFVCGLVKPRIYLPVGMNEADRRYVLLHEQAHIRRLDHLTKPLAYLILCVHWFNPILWLSYLLLCRDVEAACDQAVTHTFDQGDTAGYATALLHLGQNRTLPQAVPLAFGEENPKGRITGVLSYKKPAFWIVAVAVAACLAAAVLLLGNTDSRLDGHRIERGWVREGGVVVDFPEPMRQELIALLNEYGNQEVATSSGSPSWPMIPFVFPATQKDIPSIITVYTKLQMEFSCGTLRTWEATNTPLSNSLWMRNLNPLMPTGKPSSRNFSGSPAPMNFTPTRGFL